MSGTQYDLVIKDGLIFDGTGAPRVRGDLGISDGTVTAMGRVDAGGAEQVIDATGMHVAPGFVDLHTHYDAQVFWDPYCTLSGWHGITSVAIGNCGFGFAPVQPEATGVCHAIDDQGRGHPLRFDAARHAVGLGHVPRVSRQPRSHAEGAQHPALRAGRRRCWSRCWAKTTPRPAACRPTTSTRGWPRCCTSRWTPVAAAGRPSGCPRPGRPPCSGTGTARRCRPT